MKTALTVLVVAALSLAEARTLPSFITVCSRSVADFDACVLAATEAIRPRLARGIPELRVPPLEPLRVPEVHLEQGTKAVNYNCTLTNLDVFGLSEYVVLSEKADVVTKKRIEGSVRLPTLRMEADYEIQGRILLVPLQGKGRFSANLTDAVADIVMLGHLVEKKGTTYYENMDTKVKLNVRDTSINFENLFNGDKTLGPATNKFLNENSNDIVQEIQPAVEVVTAHLIQDIANKVFLAFSYDQLFPA